MIELDNFQKHLQTLKPKEWGSLFELIPKIESTKKFGEVKGGDELKDGIKLVKYLAS